MGLSPVQNNFFNKWFMQQQPVDGVRAQGQQPLAEQPVSGIDAQTPEQQYTLGQSFGWNVGGVTGVQGTPPAQGTARITPAAFTVNDEGGNVISCANSQGHVGCQEMASGAGSQYDPLLGHAKHTTWMIA